MGVILAVALVALLAVAFYGAATHAEAFLTFGNTEFVVLLAFLVFVGVLLYLRVPSQVSRMLDNRAETIRDELAQARSLRDEAQALVASFEKRRQEMAAQGARIVADARAEAERAAVEAREEAARSVARRLKAAEDRLASAEARAIREVRDRAVTVAVAAAREVLAEQMTPADQGRMIDQSIETVARRLN